MKLRRSLAVIVASLGLLPVLAAGRPACCAPKATPTPRACCAAMAASAPKGCCKAPAAPKSEARANPTDAPALITATIGSAAPMAVRCRPTVAEAARIAQRDHRAPSPTDSPPDRLVLHQSFLI